ncbi:glycosyltransferase family 8 protein [Oceanobacillus saliphilus]|uniref:glycosyltransferase family 8 protein n=1 Tax=Oceanobacillus saliphilus TaxID=2925834 RepID=UPI00201E50BA|nr:glycosyltransferase family 8 protein [Oceanobacillus saliphilus]
MKTHMNILVTLNSNYINPLKVMLKSLFMNHENEAFSIYLLHSSLKEEELSTIKEYVEENGHQLNEITIKRDYFADAPVVKHYSKEMYYRLLAFKFLPSDLDRILYLDPDIMIINDIRRLYDIDLGNKLFAAAYHDRASVKEINKLRLKEYEIEAYYNSGVLLMNLKLQREKINEQEIFTFVEDNKKKLILPDQDILNGLYSKHIQNIDEIFFNYDARFYHFYKLTSKNKVDMNYVIKNTSIIHFCGKKKPWHKNYSGKFHSLYKHYEKAAHGAEAL